MFYQFIQPIVLVLSISIPLWVIFRLLVTSNKRKHNKPTLLREELILLLFFVYVILVLIVTNFPIPFTEYKFPHEVKLNIIPIVNTTRGLLAAINSKDCIGIIASLENIFGNILLFIPFGLLLPVIFRRIQTLRKVVLISFLFSFSLELIQLISRQFGNYRTADIDDIILNVCGAILGLFIVRLFLNIKHAKQNAHT